MAQTFKFENHPSGVTAAVDLLGWTQTWYVAGSGVIEVSLNGTDWFEPYYTDPRPPVRFLRLRFSQSGQTGWIIVSGVENTSDTKWLTLSSSPTSNVVDLGRYVPSFTLVRKTETPGNTNGLRLQGSVDGSSWYDLTQVVYPGQIKASTTGIGNPFAFARYIRLAHEYGYNMSGTFPVAISGSL